MYGIVFFNFFLLSETPWKSFFNNFVLLKILSADFQKKSGTNGNSAHSPVCLHNLLVSFYLTLLSKAFEKVCGGYFDPNFQHFPVISKKLWPSN